VKIREVLSKTPEIQRLIAQQLVRIYAIVDANVVNGELRWRLGRRRDPQARSALEEALDSGVLVLIAPTFLKAEIEEHLPDIVAETGATLLEANREWEQFESKLRFYQPSLRVLVGEVIDPDDLPYKHASDELGLPVYTRDPHLVEMGASVVWVCIDMALRNHARARSVTLGVTLGSTYSLTIGVEALRAASKLIKSLFDGFGRLPTWLQVAIAGALTAIVIHPKSRAKLSQIWECSCASVNGAKGPLLDGFMKLADQIVTANAAADETKRQIEAALPPVKKASAVVHARRICLLSQSPLPLAEIVRRMRNEGYVSRSKDSEGYLRRVLRKNRQFVEVSRGVWRLRPV
jgi:hypothetical protein